MFGAGGGRGRGEKEGAEEGQMSYTGKTAKFTPAAMKGPGEKNISICMHF